MDFTLLRDYHGQPVSGWFMSEKLDGWRVMVSGGRLLTRGGGFLNCPGWFTAGLPDGLDAELFAGRGGFNRIQGLMADGWHGLSLEVFDYAQTPGTYRQRQAALQSLSLPGHVHLVEQIRCRDTAHLVEFADAIAAGGGEGAVVRDPRGIYVPGRSHDVLRWVPQDPQVNRLAA